MEEEFSDEIPEENKEEFTEEEKDELEEELEEEIEEFSDKEKDELEEELEEEIEEFTEEEKDELEEELEDSVEEEELLDELDDVAEDDAVEEIIEEAVEDVVEDIIEDMGEDVTEDDIEDVVEDVVEDVLVPAEEDIIEEDEEVEEAPVEVVAEPEYKSEPVPEGTPEKIEKIGGDIQIILKDVDGDLIPFGYELLKGKLVIKTDEAMKVKLVFSWFYKQSKSIEEIFGATKLETDLIDIILINPVYFGKIYFQGALVKGNFEPILTERYCNLNNINTDDIEEKYLSTK